MDELLCHPCKSLSACVPACMCMCVHVCVCGAERDKETGEGERARRLVRVVNLLCYQRVFSLCVCVFSVRVFGVRALSVLLTSGRPALLEALTHTHNMHAMYRSPS